MLDRPAPSPSGWDDDPVPTPDWMTEEEWLARCEANPDKEPPPEYEDEFWDPEEIDSVVAEADRVAAVEAAAAEHIAGLGAAAALAAVGAARRGPGQKGSARLIPGVCDGPGGGFATGQVLDVAPGGPVLVSQVEKAAGEDGRFTGVSDDELMGIIAA